MLARALALSLGLAACSSGPPAHDPGADRISARGRVTEVRSDGLLIFHERIDKMRSVTGKIEPMDPMAMVFTSGSTSIAGIAAGDLVRFDFTVDYKKPPPLRLVSIEKLPPDTKLELPANPVE
jgi:hypothetical protein